MNGVFMPAREAVCSENTRTGYRSALDRHILPALGDVLLTEVSPAMLSKLLPDFQKDHAHASSILLYNVVNGVFGMAFPDDSIPMNPMQKVKRPVSL